MSADLMEAGFEAIAKALREFGYTSVTVEGVRQAHANWKDGRNPSDVIAMFCEKDFNEHPEIFGTRLLLR